MVGRSGPTESSFFESQIHHLHVIAKLFQTGVNAKSCTSSFAQVLYYFASFQYNPAILQSLHTTFLWCLVLSDEPAAKKVKLDETLSTPCTGKELDNAAVEPVVNNKSDVSPAGTIAAGLTEEQRDRIDFNKEVPCPISSGSLSQTKRNNSAESNPETKAGYISKGWSKV